MLKRILKWIAYILLMSCLITLLLNVIKLNERLDKIKLQIEIITETEYIAWYKM